MDNWTTCVTQITNTTLSLRLFRTPPYFLSPLFGYLKLTAQLFPVAEKQSVMEHYAFCSYDHRSSHSPELLVIRHK